MGHKLAVFILMRINFKIVRIQLVYSETALCEVFEHVLKISQPEPITNEPPTSFLPRNGSFFHQSRTDKAFAIRLPTCARLPAHAQFRIK